MNTRSAKTLWMVEMAVLIAILAVLALTGLGYISYGVVSITILHIPVIITSLLLGWKAGAVIGFAFGLTSMLLSTFRGASAADLFFTPFGPHGLPVQSIIMCFVPRILLGIVPDRLAALLLHLFTKKDASGAKNVHKVPAYTIAALLSTVMHTFLVLFCMSLWFVPAMSFTDKLSAVFGVVIGVNGVLEAVAAAVIAPAVVIPVKAYLNTRAV